MELLWSYPQPESGGLARHVSFLHADDLRTMLMILTRPGDIMQLHLKPVDFFTENPALDVPSNRNLTSTLVKEESCCSKEASRL